MTGGAQPEQSQCLSSSFPQNPQNSFLLQTLPVSNQKIFSSISKNENQNNLPFSLPSQPLSLTTTPQSTHFNTQSNAHQKHLRGNGTFTNLSTYIPIQQKRTRKEHISRTGQGNVKNPLHENLVQANKKEQRTTLESSDGMVCQEQDRNFNRHCDSFYFVNASQRTGTVGVRQRPQWFVQELRFPEPTSAYFRFFSQNDGCGHSSNTSTTDHKRNITGMGLSNYHPSRRPTLRVNCLENGKSVGRRFHSSPREFFKHCRQRDNHQLVDVTEGQKTESIHNQQMDCNTRAFDVVHCEVPSGKRCVQPALSSYNIPTFTTLEYPSPPSSPLSHPLTSQSPTHHERIFGPQHQERSNLSPACADGPGSRHPGDSAGASRETQDSSGTTGNHHPVRRERGRAGACDEDRRGHQVPLKQASQSPLCSSQPPSHPSHSFLMHPYNLRKSSITRRAHTTRMPQTDEEKSAPLHVTNIQPLNVDFLLSRLLPEARERFDLVWRYIFSPSPSFPSSSTNSKYFKSSFSLDHALLLVQNNVAARATGPGSTINIPFTVLELKSDGPRQRFILWTIEENNRLKIDGYQAQVPLFHVSFYLEAVREVCASTRDLRTGFYQVEIPQYARHLFRFQSDDGSWFELLRLPMGHRCAPEIMHTLTACVAGDPRYVLPQFSAKEVCVHIWIDNIRYVGTQEAVVRESARLDENATRCNVSWKAAESFTNVQDYDFIGVHFNHSSHSVRPADKIMTKISSALEKVKDTSRLTAGELESFAGRLMHASSIADIAPGIFWFTLKFFRRLMNKLNRLLVHPNDCISIPRSVKNQLLQWCKNLHVEREVCTSPLQHTCSIFVDASLAGWGGVVIDSHTQKISVFGGAWTRPESKLHINILEAYALKNTIFSLPEVYWNSHISIWVDNTTVAGVTRKRQSVQNQLLNDIIITTLSYLKKIHSSFTLKWVKSAANPADIPSRVSPSDLQSPEVFEKVSLAVRAFLTSDEEV